MRGSRPRGAPTGGKEAVGRGTRMRKYLHETDNLVAAMGRSYGFREYRECFRSPSTVPHEAYPATAIRNFL